MWVTLRLYEFMHLGKQALSTASTQAELFFLTLTTHLSLVRSDLPYQFVDISSSSYDAFPTYLLPDICFPYSSTTYFP